MIYLDNASTTQPRSEVLTIYNQIQQEYWYNPNTLYRLGLETDSILTSSKTKIIKALNLKNKKIIFTGSATLANNLAILGYCQNKLKQNPQLNIITTKIEHPSVANGYRYLESLGYQVTYIDILSNGQIDLDQLKASLNSKTILVSIMWVNNIIGAIEPIDEVIKILKNYPRAKLHVDGVQGIGKLIPDFDYNQTNFLVFSPHKIGGVKGSGVLIYDQNINLDSIFYGANQQEKIYSGTIDIASVASAALAIDKAISETTDHYHYVSQIYQYTYQSLINLKQKLNINLEINSQEKLSCGYQSPYILNVSLIGHNSETIMHYLEQANIYVGIGSACSSKLKTLDQTIMSLTDDSQRASSFIRISFNHQITKDAIDSLINCIERFYTNAI